jgi:hypothetical protein
METALGGLAPYLSLYPFWTATHETGEMNGSFH